MRRMLRDAPNVVEKWKWATFKMHHIGGGVEVYGAHLVGMEGFSHISVGIAVMSSSGEIRKVTSHE